MRGNPEGKRRLEAHNVGFWHLAETSWECSCFTVAIGGKVYIALAVRESMRSELNLLPVAASTSIGVAVVAVPNAIEPF